MLAQARFRKAALATLVLSVFVAGCAPWNQVGLDTDPREVAGKVRYDHTPSGTVAYGPWVAMKAKGSAFPTSTLHEPIYNPIHADAVFASLSASLLNGYAEGAALDVVIRSRRWYPLERARDVAGVERDCDANSPREREVSDAKTSARIDLSPGYLEEHLSTGLRFYVSGSTPGTGILYVYVPPAYLRGFLDAISGTGQESPLPNK